VLIEFGIKYDPITTSKPQVVNGLDISKCSPEEQALILYMESLSMEERYEVLRSLTTDGKIYFKEK
jgi:hypothetical protein